MQREKDEIIKDRKEKSLGKKLNPFIKFENEHFIVIDKPAGMPS